MASRARNSSGKGRNKDTQSADASGDVKPDVDIDNTVTPSTDGAESITFWNIDEEPSIIKTNSSMDKTDSSVDNTCFKVSEKLADELTSNINTGTKSSELAKGKRSSIENIDSALRSFIPKHSNNSTVCDNGENTIPTVRNRQKSTDVQRLSSGSEEHDDSDIVEIDLNFNSLTPSDKPDTVVQDPPRQTNTQFPNSESNELFNFAMSQNIKAFGTKDDNHGVESNNATDSWCPNLEDSENIFTKSLILSGITQFQSSGSIKRPCDQDPYERQSKRVKRENSVDAFEISIDRPVKEEVNQNENSEFCPPVAIVFPMESETDKYMFGNRDNQMSKYDPKRPHTMQMQNVVANNIPQMFMSRSDGYPTDRKLDFREYTDRKEINLIKRELECEKVPSAQPLSNFDFDIDFQNTKDDFAIDITPTINQLEGYEEVLAKLMEETKANKEILSGHIGINTISQASFPLKDQITKCVPPNVTYSEALKTSPTFSKMPNHSFPQTIARNIQNIIVTNTMRPSHYQSNLGLNSARPTYPQHVSSHNTLYGRSDGQLQASALQSFSLHNDSNLLRKMISTPINDSNDHTVPNNAEYESNRNGTEPASTNGSATNGVNSTGNDKDQSDRNLPTTTKPNQPSDKPALSEQVRARVTLHHTGAKDGEPFSPQSSPTEAKQAETSAIRSTSQSGLPDHLQQPLSIQTTNPVYDRGVQDILLQHSLRRKQMSMQHHQYGGTGAPPQHYGQQFHPSQFPRAQMMADNRYASLQRRGPIPFSHAQTPNANGNSENMLLKPDMSMLDKVNPQTEYQRAEMIRNGFNPYGKETPNYGYATNRNTDDLMLQQCQGAIPHSQMSLMQQRMAGMQHSHRHPLLNRQYMNYTNVHGHSNAMQQFQRPPSSAADQSNIMTSQISSSFPGHNTPLKSVDISYQQHSFAQATAQQSQAPNMTGQPNTGANFSSFGNYARDQRHSQVVGHTENARMPFMSEYIRHQMARRGMTLPVGRQMAHHLQGSMGNRMPNVSSVTPDMIAQNSQQYPPSIQSQTPAFELQ